MNMNKTQLNRLFTCHSIIKSLKNDNVCIKYMLMLRNTFFCIFKQLTAINLVLFHLWNNYQVHESSGASINNVKRFLEFSPYEKTN